jgi:alkylhydroperoxidase family enzyme
MPSTQLNNTKSLDTATLAHALVPAGAIAEAYELLWNLVWNQPHVPASVLELCRLRIAQMHEAARELTIRHAAAGLDEAKVAALLSGRSSAGGPFSAAERAALEFAELHVMDPAAITDKLADEVKAHFGETGLVTLIEALGFIDGRIRLARILSYLELRAPA